MNKQNILAFGLGGSLGAGIALFILKKKYDAIIDTEIEEFREAKKKMKKVDIVDSDCPVEIVKIRRADSDDIDHVNLEIVYKNEDGDVVANEITLDIAGKVKVEGVKNNYRDMVASLKYSADRRLSGVDFDGDKIADYSDKEETRPIYPISLEEFGTVPLYDTDSFYCYEDGTITTCDDDPVEDVVSILGDTGVNIFKQFGINDTNVVCVRNHNLKTDYEILREIGEYNG